MAISLPLVVTLICSPALAFSRYFNRFALKSLMLMVCMVASLDSYNLLVQYSGIGW